ncbi:hypothetical protein MRS44_001797 [Fusarium solani]|jgi:hypothetical protein|uniref:Uncharacterized protein n=1 Tax=Fusarium solani TaxID=169388 RepID=A0A9P9RBV7_FUSSL|nr:uncharacterized protein B0J15DRAFT_476848 [Fusarium solani]KAH7273307.1 hypothetical protein B0J15DRAFT_476848 [Fusarium solani]KAJ3471698.1 hypothetical protein MRS44_001797 [Fusarium solani]
MAIITDAHDAESAATSSLSADGVMTPTTYTRDPSIQEWLRSSSITPSSSSNNEFQNNMAEHLGSLRVTRLSDPRPNDTFLIIDKSENRILTCHDGHLHLEHLNNDKPISKCSQWLCTEMDGFKGFKNVAGRGFLGRDIWWDFYAKVPHHKGWESFTLSRQEGGYYWIQCLNWWTLWQVSARSNGRGVVAERDGGTLWEFAKVHE